MRDPGVQNAFRCVQAELVAAARVGRLDPLREARADSRPRDRARRRRAARRRAHLPALPRRRRSPRARRDGLSASPGARSLRGVLPHARRPSRSRICSAACRCSSPTAYSRIAHAESLVFLGAFLHFVARRICRSLKFERHLWRRCSRRSPDRFEDRGAVAQRSSVSRDRSTSRRAAPTLLSIAAFISDIVVASARMACLRRRCVIASITNRSANSR